MSRIALAVFVMIVIGRPAWSQPAESPVPEVQVPETPDYVAARAKRLNDAWADLNRRLEKPVSLSFENVPVSQAASEIARQIGAPLRIDEIALEEANISPHLPVTIRIDRQAAEEAFRQIEQHGVLVTIDGTSLVLTTLDAEKQFLFTRVYDVSDLAVFEMVGAEFVDFTSLIDVFQNVTSPWFDVDGVGGAMRPLSLPGAHVLIVWQSARVHRDIENVLHDLRAVAKTVNNIATREAGDAPRLPRQDDRAHPPAVEIATPATPGYVVTRVKRAEQNWKDLNERLDRPVWINAKETPLRDVLTSIVQQIGLTPDFDEETFQSVRFGLDQAISLSISGKSAEEAIRALGQSRLVLLEGDRTVFITHRKADHSDRMTIRVYPINDLVVRGTGPDGQPGVDYAPIAMAMENANAGPWWEIDGVGGVYRWLTHDGIEILVVRQSVLVHRQIEKLFYDLRKVPKSNRPAPTPVERLFPQQNEPFDAGPAQSSSTQDRSEALTAAVPTDENLAAAAIYRDAMNDSVSLTLESTPLRQGIETLLNRTGAPIAYDHAAIAKTTIKLDRPVSLTIENQPLGEAVQTLLSQYHLASIWDGHSVVITTSQARADAFVERFYPVEDLTWTIEPDRRLTHDASQLNDVILNTTTRQWVEHGFDETAGSIRESKPPGAHFLAIRQTEDVHEEIEDLLYRIRSAKVKGGPSSR